MKRLLLVCLSLFLLSACKMGQYSQTSPMENVPYLQFITMDKQSPKSVKVYIDDNQPFEAKVNRVKSHTIKGDIYMVSKGKHRIKIMDKSDLLYDSEVFLSLQETRQIILP